MHYLFFISEQYLFDRCFQAIWSLIKLLFKLVIYSPMIITGYFLSNNILGKSDSVIIWTALILLFACMIYMISYFIKGIIIGLLAVRNFFWILFFTVSFI